MERAVSDIRGSVQDEILGIGRKSGSALISGANGSGKTALLRGLSDSLHRSGVPTHSVDCAARYSLSTIRSGPEDAVLLVDNIERADTQLLSTCLDQIRGQRPVVMTLTTGPQLKHSAHLLEQLDAGRDAGSSAISALHRIELQPLPPRDIEWLLHERSARPLDSASVRSIVTLAAGRPGWALDLLELAQHGYLDEGLHPAILEAPLNSIDLPALRSLARELTGLSPEAMAGAVALSELGAIDLAEARDLLGRPAVSELLERGVLYRGPEAELFEVPTFVATAIVSAAPTDLLEKYRSEIAHRLLAQEEILIPLSDIETALCARALTLPAPDQQHPGASSAARARVLRQAVSQSIAARDIGAVRALLLRTAEHNCTLDVFTHAQAVRLLAGPAAAVTSLVSAPTAPDPRLEQRIIHRYLLTQFEAESGLPVSDVVTNESDANQATLQQAARLFHLWNKQASPPAMHAELRDIAQSCTVPELAAFAAALTDLEQVWKGTVPANSWLAVGAPLRTVGDLSSELARCLSGALLLAQALTAFLAGECALRADELRAAATWTAAHSVNERWLGHLLSASEALACGNLQRAHLEWTHLSRTAPQLIPLRLQHYVHEVGEALVLASTDAPEVDAGTPEALPWRISRYLSGRHESLYPVAAPRGAGQEVLPIIRLAHTHLAAAGEQNPAELVRSAKRLRRLELWAPAVYALTSARHVYLSRRAAGSVRTCDELLQEIEDHLSTNTSWYRPGNFPTAHIVRLTRRERETAALAAEGFSNRQIAERLGCSIRTVESHLSQARAKLGSSSRKELARQLAHAANTESG